MIRFLNEEESTRATTPELGFGCAAGVARMPDRPSTCPALHNTARRGDGFLTLVLASGHGAKVLFVVGLAISWGIYYFQIAGAIIPR